MLDDERLYQELIENHEPLEVSPNLLFYVLCRRVLRGSGVEAREIADYLASMLGKFMTTARMNAPEELADYDLRYVCDALRAIAEATPEQAFILRAHIANYTLFLSGIFHEYIEKRWRRGGPTVKFYEEVGRSNYAVAAKDIRARKLGLEKIYGTLAASFHEVRMGLSELADRILHLDTGLMPAQEVLTV